ncbi:TetR/AcrR family transcriptional regulator [Bacillaceae bacterium CLA-AA-H227]|uniref:TetR/AcrR family transcriptional regulator n=1 Tax=Robertmurraya yapensis (ex Hitch et al 2024) TaxID=3133160 RepID=A0ACC6SBC8_9BACI
MNPIFNSLKSEKKERIINAAMKEFVQSGYEKASTNEIVKEARISKGSLFNYFNSKKDLYLYLFEYGVQIVEFVYEQIDLQEIDIFKRIEKLGIKKLQIQRRFPQIFDFLLSLAKEESDQVKYIIKEKIHSIHEEGVTRIYENIDYSMFREDIDIKKAIEILNWTMFGFGEKALNQLNSFEDVGEQYLQEWDSYSKLLKHCFYK